MFRSASILTLLSLLIAAPTSACVIDPQSVFLLDINKAIDPVPLVFSGEVVALEEFGDQGHHVEIAVHDRFKGELSPSVTARTMQNFLGLTCYVNLVVGQDFLFFGTRAADGEIDVWGYPAASDRGPELLAAIRAAVADKEQ
jgi:hypothetical protein